jgi:hypothetical protein
MSRVLLTCGEQNIPTVCLVDVNCFAISPRRNDATLSGRVEGGKLAGAAALSTGVTTDLDSCRKDVLAFLQMLRWRVVSVEVKLWTAFGLPHGTREWEVEGADYENLAQSVAQFITENGVETGAIVIARKSPALKPRRL